MNISYLAFEKEMARCATREKWHWVMHLALALLAGGSLIMTRSRIVRAATGREK